jgi:hypothetical protein
MCGSKLNLDNLEYNAYVKGKGHVPTLSRLPNGYYRVKCSICSMKYGLGESLIPRRYKDRFHEVS